MDVLYVYCYKSVGSYKHKLSRTEPLVFLYWGINCAILVFLYWGINCAIIPICQIVIHLVKNRWILEPPRQRYDEFKLVM